MKYVRACVDWAGMGWDGMLIMMMYSFGNRPPPLMKELKRAELESSRLKWQVEQAERLHAAQELDNRIEAELNKKKSVIKGRKERHAADRKATLEFHGVPLRRSTLAVRRPAFFLT